MYVPLSRFLLRAPLLPVAALGRGRAALLKHPLGAQAIAYASPSLAEAAGKTGRKTGRTERAIDRYARRAAFRATPHGLLAGVAVGRLGRATAIATGAPRAQRAPSWEPSRRRPGRSSMTPSSARRPGCAPRRRLIASGATVRWLGPGDPFVEEREAELDERLAAILEAAGAWTPWPALQGPPAATATPTSSCCCSSTMACSRAIWRRRWSDRRRLTTCGRGWRRSAARRRPFPTIRRRSSSTGRGVSRWRAPRVTRAARLVPLLVRLQEALAPPASERLSQPALADALDAVTEGFGAGAFPAAALATEAYGVSPAGDDDGLPAVPLSPPLLTLFVDAFAAAATAGRVAVALDPAALVDALGAEACPAPPHRRSFLWPAPAPGRRDVAGTGGCSGSTRRPAPRSAASRTPWARPGRGADRAGRGRAARVPRRREGRRRGHALRRAGRAGRAPAHPKPGAGPHPLRTNADTDLAVRDLALVADPAAPAALWLRARATGGPSSITPSPLARVRSATAPAGLARLMVGWSLQRQHAPWALPLGPFAGLAFVPRLSIDGFVVLPASWRLPAALRAGGPRARAALTRFRKTARLPRFVQVGEGDELLPVDIRPPTPRTIWPGTSACSRSGHRSTPS